MNLTDSKLKKLITKVKAPAGVLIIMLLSFHCMAQGDAKVVTHLDARQISVGDQARLFLEVHNNAASGRIQWAVIPDTFNKLEVVERGKIDTIKQGSDITYRQRLIITGFDSGVFRIPSFVFSAIPTGGNPYTIQSDSFDLLVQTVAVDTTKGFKGIKGIIYVKSSWLDYLPWIIGGGVLLIVLVAVLIWYLRKRKMAPSKPQGPVETLQQYTLRLLGNLEARQLWQKKQVKEYYVVLTDIVRDYIETRFQTSAMELTTDEMLAKSLELKEMQPYHDLLSQILQTADLAKFAKFQPLPQEHTDSMENAKQLVIRSKPVYVEPSLTNEQSAPNKQNTENKTPTE